MNSKIIYALVIAFIFAFTQGHAKKSDYVLIEKTLQDYIDGGTNNNYKQLISAFHEDAVVKYFKNGFQQEKAEEYFERETVNISKLDREVLVSSIDISNNGASATVHIKVSGKMIVDYLNLMKINGEWKIVDKIFVVEESTFKS